MYISLRLSHRWNKRDSVLMSKMQDGRFCSGKEQIRINCG